MLHTDGSCVAVGITSMEISDTHNNTATSSQLRTEVGGRGRGRHAHRGPRVPKGIIFPSSPVRINCYPKYNSSLYCPTAPL